MHVLRTYQRQIVQTAMQELARDKKHAKVVSLPTGSGKTRVALEIVLRFLEQNPSGRVLWLAHRWNLLEQAWLNLKQIAPRVAIRCGRIGDGGPALRSLPEDPTAQVLFTTLQTWHARNQAGRFPRLGDNHPLLVVVDECHWAATSRLGRCLYDEFLGRAWVLGISATPVSNSARHCIVASKSFADLCPEFLAKPIVKEISTGSLWNPIICRGEVSSTSLADLGRRSERNFKIVQEFLQGQARGDYRRSLIFACDIRHADELNQMLSQRGVASMAVHSKRPPSENIRAMDKFREGQLAVLVTVAMLTEGYNEPQIDTIFLARPTASPVLLAQMVGRAARKVAGKDFFRVVEFTDSMTRLGHQLFHAHAYFAKVTANRSCSQTGAATNHHAPLDLPHFEHLHLPGVEGVPYAIDQTFGVEIELGARGGQFVYEIPAWENVANSLISCLRAAARLPVHARPLDYHESDDATKWRVCFDGSCGWEVVSPILVNAEGFAELSRVCDAVTRLVETSPTLCVNRSTGLHVTLATHLNTTRRLRGFAARLTRLEPGLYTMVAPSRLYRCTGLGKYSRRGRNSYCRPISELDRLRGNETFFQLADFAGRHRSVNLTRARGSTRLLEVRMHHGTTEAHKIIPWIALWMQIFNHSRYDWVGEPTFQRLLPHGNAEISLVQARREDIFRLLEREGIVLPHAFESLLRRRRNELRQAWTRAVPHRVARWADAGWYEENPPLGNDRPIPFPGTI